jgi:uncharacterized membrane protein
MLDKLRADDRGQMGGPDIGSVILMLGVAVVIGFVVLFLSSQVIDQTQIQSGDPLYNASESLQTATNDMFALFGLLFTIVVLAVAVIYLYAIRGRR